MAYVSLAQKREMRARARFWAAHAVHWMTAVLLFAVTLSLLYAFWGNDPVFAAVVIGGVPR